MRKEHTLRPEGSPARVTKKAGDARGQTTCGRLAMRRDRGSGGGKEGHVAEGGPPALSSDPLFAALPVSLTPHTMICLDGPVSPFRTALGQTVLGLAFEEERTAVGLVQLASFIPIGAHAAESVTAAAMRRVAERADRGDVLVDDLIHNVEDVVRLLSSDDPGEREDAARLATHLAVPFGGACDRLLECGVLAPMVVLVCDGTPMAQAYAAEVLGAQCIVDAAAPTMMRMGAVEVLDCVAEDTTAHCVAKTAIDRIEERVCSLLWRGEINVRALGCD